MQGTSLRKESREGKPKKQIQFKETNDENVPPRTTGDTFSDRAGRIDDHMKSSTQANSSMMSPSASSINNPYAKEN